MWTLVGFYLAPFRVSISVLVNTSGRLFSWAAAVTRPWVLTGMVGKGDVGSFEAFVPAQASLASETRFLLSGNVCLVSTFVLAA